MHNYQDQKQSHLDDKALSTELQCYDPGPQFSFSGPLIPFPRHSLPSNPLIDHLPSSHTVPRSTTYPPGLPHHPQGPLATSLLIVLHHQSPLRRYHQTIVRLNRELYCSLSLLSSILNSNIITAHSILSSDSLLHIHHYCGSPIILFFSQLGVGTSHLYIRATISLELGLKPNLVFNPRLVASLSLSWRVRPLTLESLQSPL